MFLLHHGQPRGAAPFCRRLDQPRLDTEVLSSIWGGFIMKRTRPLWVATPTSSPLVPIHSFLTRLFGRVCLCRATRWNNKPGEVSFICSTNVYTALSLPLSLSGFACSITLPLARSLFLIHSLSVSVVLRLLGAPLPLPPLGIIVLYGVNRLSMCVLRSWGRGGGGVSES